MRADQSHRTELEYFTEVDFDHHVAIGVALLQAEQELPIGIGRYVVSRPDHKSAEIAFTVDDDYQGIGVGSLLLKHLSHIAKDKGIFNLDVFLQPITNFFKKIFKSHITADICEIGVDYKVDICNIPFEDDSFEGNSNCHIFGTMVLNL